MGTKITLYLPISVLKPFHQNKNPTRKNQDNRILTKPQLQASSQSPENQSYDILGDSSKTGKGSLPVKTPCSEETEGSHHS